MPLEATHKSLTVQVYVDLLCWDRVSIGLVASKDNWPNLPEYSLDR